MPQGPTPDPAAHHHADGREDHRHDQGAGLFGRRRALAPHSHDVTDQLDDALATSERGIRITELTLAILLATALFQLAIVAASGSVAGAEDLAGIFIVLTIAEAGVWVG